ncbi:chorismate synthase, partial [Fusobacterium animalis D11]
NFSASYSITRYLFLSVAKISDTLNYPIISYKDEDFTISKDYENLKDLLRPNHADYPARIKFKGFNDIRGGGHFSGRITLPLIYAGAIAIDILEEKGVKIFSHIKRILDIKDKSFLDFKELDLDKFKNLKENSLPFIENDLEDKTKELLEKIKLSGNSVGGEIECACFNLPVGLGSPFFDSLESKISHLAFSVPAIKGISFGIGFEFANILGSEANDLYYLDNNEIKTRTNNNGGILGGLSTGMPLVFSVVVKPTSSISLEQKTVNIKEMKEDILKINGRHDACIVPRVLPVIEAVMALAILDEIL